MYQKVRDLVKSGELGELKRIVWIITNWYRPQAYHDSSDWRSTWKDEGGGVLINQCPHQLDLIQWVIDEMPKRIRSFVGFGKYHNIEVEDDVTAYSSMKTEPPDSLSLARRKHRGQTVWKLPATEEKSLLKTTSSLSGATGFRSGNLTKKMRFPSLSRNAGNAKFLSVATVPSM